MTPLTVEELLFLHHRIVVETGGSQGVRDLGLVEAALLRPFAGFGDHEAFPTLFEKVAVVMASIIQTHPFVDGNKRTGVGAAASLLTRNGYRLRGTQREIEDFAVRVATDHPEVAVIAAWLADHTQLD